MTEKISIDDLYSDVGSFDEEAVLRTLKGKVVVTKENKIVFSIDPTKLKAREAILLYMLTKKALKLNQRIDDELTKSAEIAEKTKLRDNTIRVTMNRLKEKSLLIQSGSGYEIPAFKVTEVLNSLGGNQD